MKKEIDITLKGISDIMFDRFYDHSKEDRPPEKKLYLDEKGVAVLPNENVYSFLFRETRPTGIIKKVEGKPAKDFIDIGQAHIAINPTLIPFLDDKDKPIKFKGFNNGSGFYINDWSAPVTVGSGKAIKQEIRLRPVLALPWQLKFNIVLFDNNKVTPDKLESWFEQGGIVTALGSYRPRHGRFQVVEFDVK